MPSSRSLDDDFILTLSDQDELPASSEENEDDSSAPLKASHGTKRKRKAEEEISKGKKTKKQRVQGTKPLQSAQSRDGDISSGSEEQGEQDGAIDPDFEFELDQNASTGIIEDFDGWGEDADSRRNRGLIANKKGVDIDDIIARRASKKAANGRKDDPGLEFEETPEEEGHEEGQDGGEEIPSFEDDELLALDAFGAGAESD